MKYNKFHEYSNLYLIVFCDRTIKYNIEKSDIRYLENNILLVFLFHLKITWYEKTRKTVSSIRGNMIRESERKNSEHFCSYPELNNNL